MCHTIVSVSLRRCGGGTVGAEEESNGCAMIDSLITVIVVQCKGQHERCGVSLSCELVV